MIKKTRAREQALQVLYFIDMTGTQSEEAMKLFHSHFETKDADADFAEELVREICEKLGELDELITSKLHDWKLSRISRVDRNILRIGAYEVRFCRDVPGAIILDEAIELGKKYGDTKSSSFINGVLDQIARQERGATL